MRHVSHPFIVGCLFIPSRDEQKTRKPQQVVEQKKKRKKKNRKLKRSYSSTHTMLKHFLYNIQQKTNLSTEKEALHEERHHRMSRTRPHKWTWRPVSKQRFADSHPPNEPKEKKKVKRKSCYTK